MATEPRCASVEPWRSFIIDPTSHRTRVRCHRGRRVVSGHALAATPFARHHDASGPWAGAGRSRPRSARRPCCHGAVQPAGGAGHGLRGRPARPCSSSPPPQPGLRSAEPAGLRSAAPGPQSGRLTRQKCHCGRGRAFCFCIHHKQMLSGPVRAIKARRLCSLVRSCAATAPGALLCRSGSRPATAGRHSRTPSMICTEPAAKARQRRGCAVSGCAFALLRDSSEDRRTSWLMSTKKPTTPLVTRSIAEYLTDVRVHARVLRAARRVLRMQPNAGVDH